ncbi:MAG: YopX family protein [Enterococcus avium]
MIPKYRAWNRKTQSFIDYGDLVLDLRSGKIYAGDIGLAESTIDVTDQIELMQSTGFHDTEGTEIFAGDIVIHTQKSINYGDVYHHSYAEVFQQKNGAYRIRGKHIYGTDAYGARKNLEVVGNIYEDAELLEKDSFMTEK